jgi:tRNA pseudouridine38-40 synthase
LHQQLFGEHDFSTFEKKGSDNKTSVCTWKMLIGNKQKQVLHLPSTANRFLRNMVRRITAALLLVGVGKMNEQDIVNAVLNKESLEVKLAVPAKGLFLWKIEYEFNNDL